MRRSICKEKSTGPGHQQSAGMSHISALCALSGTCVYREVSPTSQMRVDIRVKSSHRPWAKKEKASKGIDLETIFNDYSITKTHEFTVQGQCDPQIVCWHIADRERRSHCRWKGPLLSGITILCKRYRSLLCISSPQLTNRDLIGGISAIVSP